MIKVTRLNGNEFVINVEYIKFLEETPDTIITLRDGEKVIVKESADDIIAKAIRFQRSINDLKSLA